MLCYSWSYTNANDSQKSHEYNSTDNILFTRELKSENGTTRICEEALGIPNNNIQRRQC